MKMTSALQNTTLGGAKAQSRLSAFAQFGILYCGWRIARLQPNLCLMWPTLDVAPEPRVCLQHLLRQHGHVFRRGHLLKELDFSVSPNTAIFTWIFTAAARLQRGDPGSHGEAELCDRLRAQCARHHLPCSSGIQIPLSCNSPSSP